MPQWAVHLRDRNTGHRRVVTVVAASAAVAADEWPEVWEVVAVERVEPAAPAEIARALPDDGTLNYAGPATRAEDGVLDYATQPKFDGAEREREPKMDWTGASILSAFLFTFALAMVVPTLCAGLPVVAMLIVVLAGAGAVVLFGFAYSASRR